MKKRGRSTDQALLRTAINKKYQTYSHKRLIKDLEEIENQKIPTVGVTARPLQNNIFIWHANIRGPEGTLYEGGVFHLELRFPLSYPHHPPTITIFNKIPHPNVFDNYICLDMIRQNQKREEGQGWSSAYSVQSVLTQLQSFLFEQNLSQNKETVELETKKAVKQANSFKCRDCKHGGKLSCWPAFSSKQNNKEQFKILEEERALLKKQLICYHTKLPYNVNQLGLGLRVSKIPRTGNIREAQTFYDYISIRAFLKESVNRTSTNERLTHWIPVYFGKGDNEERFFKFLTKALSMIMTNSTRNFKKQFVLEVLPKLMITIIYYIMDEKKHASIRNIRLLSHIHSIFLYCLRKFPELKETIAANINKFIANQDARIKDNLPNLGSILACLSVVDSHTFSDVAEAYFSEQLDRQVLWILKAVPELLDESIQQDVDKERAKLVFKSQMTSFHMFCFYRLFVSEICESRKSRADLLEEYQQNLCKLTNKEQVQFQKKIFDIQKNIKNFNDFFKYIGLKPQEDDQILETLKKAIKNSQRKKYHGQLQTLHSVPNSQEQFGKILKNMPNYKTFFEVTQKVKEENKKKDITYEVKQKKSTEEEWRKMCIDRWSWIKEAIIYEKNLTSQQVSYKAIQFTKKGILKSEDRLMKIINEKYKNSGINYNLPKIDVPQISWKQLFLRLDLEDFLIYIDMNPDFNAFYEKLEVCRFSGVNTLLIPIVPIKQIKSGYFYLTSLLTRLNTLKYLELSGLPQKNRINDKIAKAIKKGLSNFIQEKGALDIFSIHNLIVDKDYSESLFQYITNSDKLISLRFYNTNLFLYGNAMKIFSKVLVQLKDLQELVFDQCQMNQEKCKSLADVLMRAKKLKIFEIHNSQNVNNGLSSLIYNLSFFSPNLQLLDISRCQSNVVETVVSLYKMLKITNSVEAVIARNIGGLNQNLVEQFWISLGQCRSLRVLDLAYSGDISSRSVNLGNAIAFNAKKKGGLEYIDLTNCVNNVNSITNLYQGMCISQYDQERIYGDSTKASKMISSNYKKEYFNNLKAIQLNKCGNLNPSSFNLAYWNKLNQKEDPEFVKLLARSNNLTNISLSSNGMRKNFAEVLSLAVDPRRANFKSQIKVLDLSKNNLEKDGIKALADVLPFNQIIQVLDLSKNQLGVPGASQLAIALKGNKSLKFLNLFNNKIGFDGAKSVAQNIILHHPTLECIELGHNRIRDKGLKQIVDAIVSNKNSAMKVMGLRFNYITNVGATYLYNKLTTHKTKVQQVFLRNNLIDDAAINNLQQIKQHEHSTIAIDVLEKLKYLDPERLERTIWVHPISSINLQNLKSFFEITHKCGIVLDARVKQARKYPNKMGENIFGFIQFADASSVNKALHIASKKMTFVDGIKFRIYKAGTGTFIYSKKTGKQKKLEQAKNQLPVTPYDKPAENLNMQRPSRPAGRGRGGRGGRGRGR